MFVCVLCVYGGCECGVNVCVCVCVVCVCVCVVCVCGYVCGVCVTHFQAPTKHSIEHNKFSRSVRPPACPPIRHNLWTTKGISHEAGCLGRLKKICRYIAFVVNPAAYLRPFRGTWASWAFSYIVSDSVVFPARRFTKRYDEMIRI